MSKVEPKQIFLNVMGSAYADRINPEETAKRNEDLEKAGFAKKGIALDHYIPGQTQVITYIFDDDGKCQVIGEGIFMGFEEVPIVNEDDENEVFMHLDSAKIKLSDGRYVYGFQCWWCTLGEWKQNSSDLEMSDKPVVWEDASE